MIYYHDSSFLIRNMHSEDIYVIHNENLSHGWHSDIYVYEKYFKGQEDKSLSVFIAEYEGDFAGYTTLRPQAIAGPFANKGMPEVSDFNVFIKYRRRGIGGRILDTVETTASNLNHTITLGVGLHSGYGSAQRLYINRGYIPDGSGIWYRDKQLEPYAECCNDDDLVLYMSKRLRY